MDGCDSFYAYRTFLVVPTNCTCYRVSAMKGGPADEIVAGENGGFNRSSQHLQSWRCLWVNGWLPEQIANRLQVDFPDDQSMSISHEAIHQALYIQATGQSIVSCQRGGDDLQSTCRGRRSCRAVPCRAVPCRDIGKGI